MDWNAIWKTVIDAMKDHTRPFTSPLSKETEEHVRVVGTGTYVFLPGGRGLVTCEHVSRESLLNAGIYGSEDVLALKAPFAVSTAKDIAYAPIDDGFWNATVHSARCVPFDRFAVRHIKQNCCSFKASPVRIVHTVLACWLALLAPN